MCSCDSASVLVALRCPYVGVNILNSVCVLSEEIQCHGAGVDRAPGYMTIRCDRHEWKINPLMWHLGRTDRK